MSLESALPGNVAAIVDVRVRASQRPEGRADVDRLDRVTLTPISAQAAWMTCAMRLLGAVAGDDQQVEVEAVRAPTTRP